MYIRFVTIQAYSGAKCRSCENTIIPKGSFALEIGVDGAKSGDREFCCIKCIPKVLKELDRIIKEWKAYCHFENIKHKNVQ